MSARKPEQILAAIIDRKGKGAKVRRKLTTNKERNWLLAVVLHSCAKFAANTPLTDLEQTVVQAFRTNGFSDETLKMHGRLYQTMPQTVRNEIFPTRFAQLTPQSKYALSDLRQDSEMIVRSVLSMRNVTKIDVQAVHEDRASIEAFPMPSRDVLKQYAGAMMIATEPDKLGTSLASNKYTIKAESFHCSDETGWDWTGSDEPYWIFGSLGSGTPVTTRSQVFGDVDSGDNRTFAANEGCIWGQNCLAQPLPEGEIAALVQLYEHDCGDPTAIKNGVSAAFAAAAGILTLSGVASWIAAVVAGVGAVLQWLLGFLDDDHIADQVFIFTRQAIEDQIGPSSKGNKPTYFYVNRRFSDGDGDYSLKIKVARVS